MKRERPSSINTVDMICYVHQLDIAAYSSLDVPLIASRLLQVSLGDIATYVQPGLAGKALSEISKFGGPHDQSGSSGAVKPKAT